jgi:2-polyprenyl-6-methoxyphenol hydroxylase-like FAD-dependent oxidoreductase
MKIAISGAGIAGGTLAYWLHKAGHEPLLIERAPALRTGGYVMDFWGLGYTVAERMGILPGVRESGYQVERVDFVGDDGRRVSGFPVDALRSLTHGRLTSVARGDLAAEIFRALDGQVEIVFGDAIAAIEETGAGVELALESGARRSADILVGADGLNSRVRRLAFGPDENFRRDLGYRFAVFSLPAYRPRDELAYKLYSAPGRQIGRFTLRDDRALILFAFHAPPIEAAQARARLREIYAGMGWETQAILARLDEAEDFYYDDVAQIRMPTWRQRRVALVGDAAAAVSFMAGEGAGLAMTEAYALAGELARADYAEAFAAYERRLMPFLRDKQHSAEAFVSTFVPETEFGLWLRNQASRLMGLPGMARLMLGRSVRDDFDLPDYG